MGGLTIWNFVERCHFYDQSFAIACRNKISYLFFNHEVYGLFVVEHWCGFVLVAMDRLVAVESSPQ